MPSEHKTLKVDLAQRYVQCTHSWPGAQTGTDASPSSQSTCSPSFWQYRFFMLAKLAFMVPESQRAPCQPTCCRNRVVPGVVQSKMPILGIGFFSVLVAEF